MLTKNYIFKNVMYGRTISIVGSTPMKTSTANPAKRQTATRRETPVKTRFTNFNRESFVNTVDIHHTYLGMFILLLANNLIMVLQEKRDLKRSWVIGIIVLIIILTYILYAVNSKVSMLTLLVLVIFHMMAQFTKKNTLVYLVVLGATLSVFIMFNGKAI